MFKKFRTQVLYGFGIHPTEEARRELDKLNFIKFCCKCV